MGSKVSKAKLLQQAVKEAGSEVVSPETLQLGPTKCPLCQEPFAVPETSDTFDVVLIKPDFFGDGELHEGEEPPQTSIVYGVLAVQTGDKEVHRCGSYG